jgi:hypothetical protein
MLCVLTAIALWAAQSAFAQTTLIAYQGNLDIDGSPASGNYDIQFKLFDAATDGAQQGSTLEQLNLTVTNGAYTVNLDFGAAVFSGADRFLESSVRPAGSGTYTTQSPRTQINSTPYSIRSLVATTADGLSATCASCVTSSQIQNVQGSQVTGAVAGSQITGTIPVASVPAGSDNYIQNTTNQQTANFKISGNGTAGGTLSGNAVNATTQYNIGTQRVLSVAGIGNLFVGLNTGPATTGDSNSFFGSGAGFSNTTASGNSFFGRISGQSTTTGGFNSFFGYLAGASNTKGRSNSFFGSEAGFNNTTGQDNSFVGDDAGGSNTTGTQNSFFGRSTGSSNATGNGNSFFGAHAGFASLGSFNSFFGYGAGASNSTGTRNSFFGSNVGFSNTTGSENSFFGDSAGTANTSASGNSFFGYLAGVANTGDSNAFFGTRAGQSNTTGKNNSLFGTQTGFSNTTGHDNSFFGYIAGISNTTGQLNAFVGASAGGGNTSGIQNSFFGSSAGSNNSTGSHNTFIGHSADFDTSNPIGDDNTLLGYNTAVNSGVSNATAIGSGAQAIASNTIVLGTKLETVIVRGKLQVDLLGAGGSQQLCLNNSSRLAPCSSSLRYKTDLRPFAGGLSVINRLQPVSFTWKEGGMRDVGFGAEDVEKVEPLLVTHNAQGLVEGLKYDRISVVLVNALKEQQVQIATHQAQLAAQQTQLEEQRSQIENLKRFICLERPNTGICK